MSMPLRNYYHSSKKVSPPATAGSSAPEVPGKTGRPNQKNFTVTSGLDDFAARLKQPSELSDIDVGAAFAAGDALVGYSRTPATILRDILALLAKLFQASRDLHREIERVARAMAIDLLTIAFEEKIDAAKKDKEGKDKIGWGDIFGGLVVFAAAGVCTNGALKQTGWQYCDFGKAGSIFTGAQTARSASDTLDSQTTSATSEYSQSTGQHFSKGADEKRDDAAKASAEWHQMDNQVSQSMEKLYSAVAMR